MGVELDPGLADKAAALLAGLSRNYFFRGGEKCSEIGAVNVLMTANGSRFAFDSGDEAADFMEGFVQVAGRRRFGEAWLMAHVGRIPRT